MSDTIQTKVMDRAQENPERVVYTLLVQIGVRAFVVKVLAGSTPRAIFAEAKRKTARCSRVAKMSAPKAAIEAAEAAVALLG